MFNIGASELVLILLIAFIVVGPNDLPKVARALGRFVRKVRTTIKELKKESGLDTLEDEFKGISREIENEKKEIQRDLKAADIREELKSASADIDKEIKSVKKDMTLKDLNETGGTKK